jgi:hypothetical protein
MTRLNGFRQQAMILLIGVLTVLAVGIARADVLILEDGRKLEGKVTINKKGGYEIKMKYGSLTFKAQEVKKLIRDGKGPVEEPKKKPGGGEKGSDGEKPKKVDPDPALPTLSPDEKTGVLKVLPSKSLYKESSHYAVASSASKAYTKKYSVLFERVRKGFYKYFESRGFDLNRHTTKLEAVIFKDEASFKKFARSSGMGGPTAGFYTTRTNRLYFYDSSLSQSAKSSEASLKRFKDHLDTIKKQKKQAEKAKNSRAVKHYGEFYRKELKRYKKYKKELSSSIDDFNKGITIHESVHQLCYNSGLLHISDLNPEWLVEGLAMLFEDPAVWQGRHVGKGNKQRVESLARAIKAGRQIKLVPMVSSQTQLIARRDPHFAYASSWALIHFFIVGKFRKYKAPFFEYLKGVRAMTKGMTGRKRHSAKEAETKQLKLFREKFGDVNKLEKEFRAYVKKLIEK